MNGKCLDIGITNVAYNVYDDGEKFGLIAADGYKNVDFQQLAHPYSPLFSLCAKEFEAALLQEKHLIEESGLRISQAHAPWVGEEPRDRSSQERKAWFEFMKKALEGANIVGAPLFVAHPLLPYDCTDKNPEEVMELNLEFFSALAAHAAQYGITVCIENLPFPSYPPGSAAAVCALVDMVGAKDLGVCLDTGHAAVFDLDVASAVRRCGSRLRTLHVHDNMGDKDAHLNVGDGKIDWDAFGHALRDVGYSGVISLETRPRFESYEREDWLMIRTGLADRARRIARLASGLSV